VRLTSSQLPGSLQPSALLSPGQLPSGLLDGRQLPSIQLHCSLQPSILVLLGQLLGGARSPSDLLSSQVIFVQDDISEEFVLFWPNH
jgi:hypothetical protein